MWPVIGNVRSTLGLVLDTLFFYQSYHKGLIHALYCFSGEHDNLTAAFTQLKLDNQSMQKELNGNKKGMTKLTKDLEVRVTLH